MQKDIHFYLTYALAVKAGLSIETVRKIAWACQYVDDMTKAELHGAQTQCSPTGNWSDRQVQYSVLVPFHFLPGSKGWIVEANSKRARAIVEAAGDDPLRFGIALHALQDTFSHQGFTGWVEDANACYWFNKYIPIPFPNIGHADMGYAPDITNAVWYDPRTEETIDNKVRAMAAAEAVYEFLSPYRENWPEIAKELKVIFNTPNYEKRKQMLRDMAEDDEVRYSKLIPTEGFVKAARQHLAAVMKSL